MINPIYTSKTDQLSDTLFFKYYLTNISDIRITPSVLRQIGTRTNNHYFKNSSNSTLSIWKSIYHDSILCEINDNIISVIKHVLNEKYTENIPNVSHIKYENIDDLLSLKDTNSELNHIIVTKHDDNKSHEYSLSVILDILRNNINQYESTNQVDNKLFNLIVEQCKLMTNLVIINIQKETIGSTVDSRKEKTIKTIDLILNKSYQDIMGELTNDDSYRFNKLSDIINDINALGNIEKSTIYNVKDLNDLIYSITEYIKDKKLPDSNEQDTDINKLLLSLFVLTDKLVF